MNHPRRQLHDALGPPVRLSLLAVLVDAEEVDFQVARDLLEVNDSVLSKQAKALEEAGLISVRKGHVGRRPRTWLSATEAGRAAFEQHRAALLEIVSIQRAAPSR